MTGPAESDVELVARDRATRWGYRETLSPEEFEAYVAEMVAKDENLRADLAALGPRVLPAGGVEREEKAVFSGGAFLVIGRDYQLVRGAPRYRRTVIEWPDGSMLVGAWKAVER